VSAVIGRLALALRERGERPARLAGRRRRAAVSRARRRRLFVVGVGLERIGGEPGPPPQHESSTAAPTASIAAGPNQSSAVVDLSGGR
jgi:hypothetical protein